MPLTPLQIGQSLQTSLNPISQGIADERRRQEDIARRQQELAQQDQMNQQIAQQAQLDALARQQNQSQLTQANELAFQQQRDKIADENLRVQREQDEKDERGAYATFQEQFGSQYDGLAETPYHFGIMQDIRSDFVNQQNAQRQVTLNNTPMSGFDAINHIRGLQQGTRNTLTGEFNTDKINYRYIDGLIQQLESQGVDVSSLQQAPIDSVNIRADIEESISIGATIEQAVNDLIEKGVVDISERDQVINDYLTVQQEEFGEPRYLFKTPLNNSNQSGGATPLPISPFITQSADNPLNTPRDEDNTDIFIHREASKHGVDPNLIRAIIFAESNGDPNAVSAVGAKGLMQLMDTTASSYGVSNPFDPSQNISGGTQLIADLLKRYSGNLELVLAAYNAGEPAVNKYKGIPPFKETQDYVPKVIAEFNRLSR